VGSSEPKTGDRLDGAGGPLRVFEYPASPGAPPRPAWDGWLEAPGAEGRAGQHGAGRGADSAHGPIDDTIDEGIDDRIDEWIENPETRPAFEAGRERGRHEGRELERAAQSGARKNEEESYKRQIAKLIADFLEARERFLRAAEPEVVKLALAVAARILRREAQMDPLLLMGAVRVALGQIAGTSEVTLRVPAEQHSLWAEALALVPNLPVKPKIVAEERMRLGDCVIESQAGTVDLGVRSQLAEIERGFFDRAATREQPAVEAATGAAAADEAGA